MADVIMPKLGDAMEEGKIVRWLKNVGDSVKSDDPIFEVETDKTNVEVGADVSGVLEWIGYAAGVSVPVGKPIARIGDGVRAHFAREHCRIEYPNWSASALQIVRHVGRE
mgnify:CR=1 FL=1